MDKLTQKMIDAIDMRPLEKYVGGIIGLPVMFHVALRPNDKIEMESNDVTGGVGIFRAAITRAYVHLFFNEGNTKGVFYSGVSLAFELTGGGSNGVSIGFAYYSFPKKKWNFNGRWARSW